MAITDWTMRLYDLAGAPVNVVDNYDSGASSNEILYWVDPKWAIPLNGVDTLTFTLYLDDNMAAEMKPLLRVVKMWRNINDAVNGITYTAPADEPDFVGIIAAVHKQGESNTCEVTCYNPLWRLQFHFHILNHLEVKDVAPFSHNHQGANNDGSYYTQSALMFRLIDLTNGAFGNYETGKSASGIVRPESGPPYWADPPELEMAPFFVPKGSNTWANLMENLLSRYDGVDLTPKYYHADGSARLMYFETAVKRGADVSATTNFDYHTGDYTAADMEHTVIVEQGKFANYLWAVGQGDANKVYAGALDDSGQYGMTAAKIHMLVHQAEQETGTLTDNETARNIHSLQVIANGELARSKHPTDVIAATLNPVVETTPEAPNQTAPYYGIDYTCGDVVTYRANKGALVMNRKQRVYEVTLGKTEGGAETAEIVASKDFYEKVAVTT